MKYNNRLLLVMLTTIFFVPLFVIGQPFEVSVKKRNVSASIVNSGVISIDIKKGNAPYTYSWSNGKTEKEIGGLKTGTYTVTITDSKKQQVKKAVTINYRIKWKEIVGLVIKGEKISKKMAKGWGNAGMVSANTLLVSEDGFLEVKLTKVGAVYMIGLSENSKDQHYRDIDNALYIANQRAYIFEAGRRKGYIGKIKNGDVLTVKKSGNTIFYLKNGKIYYKSIRKSKAALKVDVSVHRGIIDADIVTSFGNAGNESHSFAILQKKLNNNFYLIKDGKLLFKYKEAYSTGKMKFKVLDESRTIVLSDKKANVLINEQAKIGQKKIGNNECQLIVDSLKKDAYYILVVENEKKQKLKLRFYIP